MAQNRRTVMRHNFGESRPEEGHRKPPPSGSNSDGITPQGLEDLHNTFLLGMGSDGPSGELGAPTEPLPNFRYTVFE